MRGYKMLSPDWTSQGLKYVVGMTYHCDEEIRISETGHHFCERLADCWRHDDWYGDEKIVEVIAGGKIVKSEEDSQCSASDLAIVRELSREEVSMLCGFSEGNAGSGNYGICNTGNHNSGDWNVGSWNVGSHNVGNRNFGDRNIGDNNIGDWNVGDWNVGNSNHGCWNTRDYLGGFICVEGDPLYFFDALSNWTMADWVASPQREILSRMPILPRVAGRANPSEKIARKKWWSGLAESEKKCLTELPNFDQQKFRIILGVEEKKK